MRNSKFSVCRSAPVISNLCQYCAHIRFRFQLFVSHVVWPFDWYSSIFSSFKVPHFFVSLQSLRNHSSEISDATLMPQLRLSPYPRQCGPAIPRPQHRFQVWKPPNIRAPIKVKWPAHTHNRSYDLGKWDLWLVRDRMCAAKGSGRHSISICRCYCTGADLGILIGGVDIICNTYNLSATPFLQISLSAGQSLWGGVKPLTPPLDPPLL